MTITVDCPGCSTPLNAPVSAAGKHVRCPIPGCGEIVYVPAFPDQEVVDAVAVPPKTRHRDEDHERARPRRRRRNAGGGVGTALAIVSVVFMGLALVVGIGYGVYALVGKKSPPDSAKQRPVNSTVESPADEPQKKSGTDSVKKAPPPAGWKQYSYPTDSFKAYFPAAPRIERDNTPAVPGPLAGGDSYAMYKSGGFDDPLRAFILAVRFRPGLQQAQRERLVAEIHKMVRAEHTGSMTTRTVTWLGQQADELAGEEAVARIVTTDTAVYLVGINARGTDRSDIRARPEEEKAFFDNFELLK
jgi:hypothetical protein